jgi:hypothetical protein
MAARRKEQTLMEKAGDLRGMGSLAILGIENLMTMPPE